MIVGRSLRSSVGALVVLAVLLGACGSGRAAPAVQSKGPNEKLEALVAAAREEGELSLSWTAGSLDAPGELNGHVDGFNRAYGLNLKVRFAAAGTASESAARLLEETQAGQPAFTDVFLGTETQIAALARAATLSPELWSTWAPNIGNLKLLAPGGIAVQVQTRIPGITYNSQRLTGADIPRSLNDLLRARFRGKVATTADVSTLDRLASPDVWAPDKAISFLRRLAPQIGGVIECGDEGRIMNGEFDAFVYDCGSARVAQLKAEGALIGWSVPSDAPFVRYLYMGVPKKAAHPNAAKLWLNYMVGRQAQDIMFQHEYADHHLIPGSRSFVEVDRATKAGVKFYELTVESLQAEEARGFKSTAPEIQTLLLRNLPSTRR